MLGLSKNERLEKAIEKREWDKVSKLIDKGAVPAFETLLDAAAADDVAADRFAILFKSGAEKTPKQLQFAVTAQNLAKAEFLISGGVVPYQSTLLTSVQRGDLGWVNMLVNAGAKPDAEMLFNTLYEKNIHMAQALIGKGVFSTKLMRDYAEEHMDKRWVKVLDDAKRMPTPENLHEVVCSIDLKEAQALIDEGAVPDNKTLSYAIKNGLGADCIGMLVKARGTSVGEMLETAARANDGALADILLGAGVLPSQKALAYVVEQKMSRWVKAFVDKGAKPTVEMLNTAVRNRDGECGNALLNAGVVPSQETLAYAVEHKMSQWVQVFVARGGKPTAEMLEVATRNQDSESGNAILNAGVKPSQKALAYAVENKMSNWVKVFIARGGKPTVAMMDTATFNQDAESGTALLKAGIVPSERALNYAVQNKLDNGGWAKIFIAQGAKPSSGTLAAAMFQGDMGLFKLILAKGVVPDALTMRYASNSEYWQYHDLLQKVVNDNKAKAPAEAYNEAAAPPPPKTEEVKVEEPKEKRPRLVLGKNENDNAPAAPAASTPRPKKIILSRPKNGA